MKPNTQSEIEKKLAQIDSINFDPQHMDAWTLNLGDKKALLHPSRRM
jgi:hypothetical protein